MHLCLKSRLKFLLSLSCYSLAMIIVLNIVASFYGTYSQLDLRSFRFSTKSSYQRSKAFDSPDNLTISPQCFDAAEVFVTAIFRHGIRYPGLKDVKNARSLLEKLQKASVSSELYARLDDTLNRIPDNDKKDLTPSGVIEHFNLGLRFGQKYVNLYEHASEGEIGFYVTSKSRTVQSFRGFLEGFKSTSRYKFTPLPVTTDDLLRFFDNCKKYVKEVNQNKSAVTEAKQYMAMEREYLNRLIEKATSTKNLNVTYDELDSLLDVSGCEDAIFETNNWASVMSDEVFDILNYASDLEDYWKKGPGFPINYEQSCILISHMFKEMDDVIEGRRSKKGSYYFAHAETLYPVFAGLGIFIDDPPLLHNNSFQHKSRKFVSTRINPFASNIAFILRNCSGEIFIELMFKENPLNWTIPMCHNYGHSCPYKIVRERLAKYIDKCNFEELCEETEYPRNVEL